MHLADHVEDASADADGVDDSSAVGVSAEDGDAPAGSDGGVIPVVCFETENHMVSLVGKDGPVITLPSHVYAQVREFLVRRTVLLPLAPPVLSGFHPGKGDDGIALGTFEFTRTLLL